MPIRSFLLNSDHNWRGLPLPEAIRILPALHRDWFSHRDQTIFRHPVIDKNQRCEDCGEQKRVKDTKERVHFLKFSIFIPLSSENTLGSFPRPFLSSTAFLPNQRLPLA